MEISPIEMYKLPSDVYSPRCSPSGSENQLRAGASQRTRQFWELELPRAALGRPTTLIINEL